MMLSPDGNQMHHPFGASLYRVENCPIYWKSINSHFAKRKIGGVVDRGDFVRLTEVTNKDASHRVFGWDQEIDVFYSIMRPVQAPCSNWESSTTKFALNVKQERKIRDAQNTIWVRGIVEIILWWWYIWSSLHNQLITRKALCRKPLRKPKYN